MTYNKAQTKKIDTLIWEKYEQTRDINLRNEILRSYLYIVSCSIKKMWVSFGSSEDIEDMTSQGVIELINCIERYDWRKGVQFDSYASIRIRGSIIDYIRKNDWVPRDVRKKAKLLNDTYQDMQSQLGRAPSDKELESRLNISESEINKIRCDELSFNVLAFEELLYNNEITSLEIPDNEMAMYPDNVLLENEFKDKLAEYIDELDEKEKMVISLYYYEELKLKEIAFILGLTASRVSQIHSKALVKLKKRIESYINV